jgi:eukaryotic-like serine/threonine-protein kinase
VLSRLTIDQCVDDDVKRQLAALADAEIQQCLTKLAQSGDHDLTVTLDFVPESRQRYALTRLHATGGIGQVWVARDGDLGREIALKELRADKAASGALYKRFLREFVDVIVAASPHAIVEFKGDS